jgi:hypothetical protein
VVEFALAVRPGFDLFQLREELFSRTALREMRKS